jgi:orotate phosphoribosyltransferase-like protein
MFNFTPKGWRHIQGIYTNNVHKSNRQRHSKNVQIKWKQIDLHSHELSILITIMYDLHSHELSILITIMYDLHSHELPILITIMQQ